MVLLEMFLQCYSSFRWLHAKLPDPSIGILDTVCVTLHRYVYIAADIMPFITAGDPH